jgi:hypothetical protein
MWKLLHAAAGGALLPECAAAAASFEANCVAGGTAVCRHLYRCLQEDAGGSGPIPGEMMAAI